MDLFGDTKSFESGRKLKLHELMLKNCEVVVSKFDFYVYF